MSTIVEATVPAAEFALEETLDAFPDAEFRMVRLVEYSSDDLMPFLWAACDREEQLYEQLEGDSTTAEVDVLAEFDSECLVRVDWAENVRSIVSFLGEEDAIILDASGRDGAWHLQIFYPNHESISGTYDFCEEYGIDISLDRICRLSKTCEYGHLGLTEEQYETVITAYEAGYYDVPRAINQEELADYFGISHQALSERLRRAHQTLIANALYQKIQRRDESVSPRMNHEIEARFAGTSG